MFHSLGLPFLLAPSAHLIRRSSSKQTLALDPNKDQSLVLHLNVNTERLSHALKDTQPCQSALLSPKFGFVGIL